MGSKVVIIGGGPAGTATAISLAQRGIESVVVERAEFPRFHIGESMTGCCGVVVRELGLEERMEERKHPIKHGVHVIGPEGRSTFWVPVMGRKDETGELYKMTTWQVRRADFDSDLERRARDLGVEYVRGTVTGASKADDGSVRAVAVKTEEGERELPASVVVDASGAASVLSKIGVTGERERGRYDRQLAVYSHIKGARRDPGEEGGNTLIFYRSKNHWAWFIPIDDEVVSIGIVTPSDYFKSKGESRRDFYLRELRQISTALTERVEDIELVEDVHASSNYSYHVKQFTGPNYLCVGDSHRFIDPIFSFGLHFAVTEARFAAEAIDGFLNGGEKGSGGDGDASADPFADYAAVCERGMDRIEDMVDCFWFNPAAFVFYAHHKYTDQMIDAFAGRVYQEEETDFMRVMRVAAETAIKRPDSVLL